MLLVPETQFEESAPIPSVAKTPEDLTAVAVDFAARDGWMDRVRLSTAERWYERLYQDAEYDVWAISWMPGQATGFHDHGASSGAFVVATGVLEEHRPGNRPLAILPGRVRAFGRDYAHDVRNASQAPAVSIHVYSPPLTEMNEFELDGDRLVPREQPSPRAEALAKEWRADAPLSETPHAAQSIEQLLAAARSRLHRLSPLQAQQATIENGAILVDIRPEAQRAAEGSIPAAVIIERNVLEWRLDPASSARLAFATSHDVQAIVFCSEGYTSSLAAAALQDLGLWRATDIAGGFKAWVEAGLPFSLFE